MESLLRPEEVAAILSISPRKVYAIKSEIGHVELGGNVRFERAAVEAYIEQCRREPTTRAQPVQERGNAKGYETRRKVTAADISRLLEKKRSAGE